MNGDTFSDTADDLGGKADEGVGDATTGERPEGESLRGQMTSDAQKAYGKFREFAKANPAALTALAGVFGLAVIGSIRKRA